jgi:anti-sigma factor RsiW
MNVTRDIVLDVLPLYLAGEARPETVAAVEAFLAENPELAQTVAEVQLPRLKEVPKPISMEAEMEAYKKANMIMTVRTIVLAVVISGTVLAILLIVPAILLAFR